MDAEAEPDCEEDEAPGEAAFFAPSGVKSEPGSAGEGGPAPAAGSSSEGEGKPPQLPPYIATLTQKRRFRRLHRWEACPAAKDAARGAIDHERIYGIEGAGYHAACRRCWPKGARPGEAAEMAERVAGIVAAAEDRVQDSGAGTDSSSSTRGSSGSSSSSSPASLGL